MYNSEPKVFYITWLTPFVVQLVWNLTVFGQVIGVLIQMNKTTDQNPRKTTLIK